MNWFDLSHPSNAHMRWRQRPRVEMALVSESGIPCLEHGYCHWIPDTAELTLDMNGATRMCETLRNIIPDALSEGRTVRVIRQGATHLTYY